MDDTTVAALFICFAGLITEVDSRICTFKNSNGDTGFFPCTSYEYCCGRGCCRSPTLTFYQLWYFWLSVILILLLCSGGGWWYRFKYRGHVYTQPSAAAPANAFFYPQADRIMLQNIYKDNRYPQASYGVSNSPCRMSLSHPPYSPAVPTSVIPPPPPPGAGPATGSTAYPTYPEAPPSYNSIFGQGKETTQSQQ